MASLRQIIKKLRVRSTPRLLLVVLVVICAIGIGVAYPSEISNSVTLATSHLPEGYTQLNFANQSSLPQHANIKVATPFSFEVTNYEGRPRSYEYLVTATAATGTKVIASGNVSLQNGSMTKQTVYFTIPASNSSLKLTVSLSDSGQQINFRSQT